MQASELDNIVLGALDDLARFLQSGTWRGRELARVGHQHLGVGEGHEYLGYFEIPQPDETMNVAVGPFTTAVEARAVVQAVLPACLKG